MSTVETARGPADTAPTTRTAVLIDFGGVITTSVLRAFEQFGELLGAPPGLVLGLLSHDTAARELMVEHECGRIDADAFDRGSPTGFPRTAWWSSPRGCRHGCRPGCVATTTPCG